MTKYHNRPQQILIISKGWQKRQWKWQKRRYRRCTNGKEKEMPFPIFAVVFAVHWFSCCLSILFDFTVVDIATSLPYCIRRLRFWFVFFYIIFSIVMVRSGQLVAPFWSICGPLWSTVSVFPRCGQLWLVAPLWWLVISVVDPGQSCMLSKGS